MKRNYDVIIVGSGIAGLSAAEVLAGAGVDVLVIDDNAQGGGQLLRSPGRPDPGRSVSQAPWYDRAKKEGFRLMGRITGSRVDRLHSAQVLGLFAGPSLAVETGPDDGTIIKASCVLLATGARERFLPFKGWTLPGVISTGGAQILIKSHGILPGRETLVAGTGPLQLALASEILRYHGRVTAVLDHQDWRPKLGFLPLWKHQWPRIAEGMVHLSRILGRGVPLMQGTGILEARGKRSIESVVAARLDSRGKPVPGTQTIYMPKTLAVGYGFLPNIELAVQAGCETVYDRDRGGWVVRVNNRLETSMQSVFAAGEITGIAGGGKSRVEGLIASRSILDSLGHTHRLPKTLAHRKTAVRLEKLRGLETRYGTFLNRLCHIPDAAFRHIHDDTIICRCEEITMKEIKGAMSRGFLTTGAIKKATRCSMGRCQGRTCGPVISAIISAHTSPPSGSIAPVPARFPVKTVSLATLAQLKSSTDSLDLGNGLQQDFR